MKRILLLSLLAFATAAGLWVLACAPTEPTSGDEETTDSCNAGELRPLGYPATLSISDIPEGRAEVNLADLPKTLDLSSISMERVTTERHGREIAIYVVIP